MAGKPCGTVCRLPAAINHAATRPNKHEIGCVDCNREPHGSFRVATFHRAKDGIVARVFGDERNRHCLLSSYSENSGWRPQRGSIFVLQEPVQEAMHARKLPHLFALFLAQALLREHDGKGQNHMPINTGSSVPNGKLRPGIVDNRCRKTQEFTRLTCSDLLEPCRELTSIPPWFSLWIAVPVTGSRTLEDRAPEWLSSPQTNALTASALKVGRASWAKATNESARKANVSPTVLRIVFRTGQCRVAVWWHLCKPRRC